MSSKKRKTRRVKTQRIREKLQQVEVKWPPEIPEEVPVLVEAIKTGYVDELVVTEPEPDQPKPSWWDRFIGWF